ncbi:MAG: hypothetical protein GY696_27750, partial [Gammaproteobacteria bacterium]|nr:hypothetical protein [Gammaproteobacteria bacterium]
PEPVGDDTPAPTPLGGPEPVGDDTPAPTPLGGPEPVGDDTPAPTPLGGPEPVGDDTPAPTPLGGPEPVGCDRCSENERCEENGGAYFCYCKEDYARNVNDGTCYGKQQIFVL